MNLNDLMTSETTTQEPTYSWGLDFDVISAVEEEKKSAKDIAREKLTNHLKQRSELRKAIRSWEKSSWNKQADNKTVNTSTLADTFTDVMVSLGKDPAYMQERYWTSEWNIELINKMKGLQGGKYSGDIQNYIEGKNTDLTWLVNNMFPDYIAAKTWTPTQVTTETVTTQPVKKEEVNALKWDTRSWWEKMAEWMSQFRWSDIWLESERRPLKPVIEFWAWVYDDLRKVVPWIKSIANSLTMDKPEDFAKKIDDWMYKDDYAYDKEHWYTWSYNQWKQDMKDKYEEKYNKETSLTKEIDKNKWDMRFNLVDEESKAFKWWELTSEIWQQILLDRRLTSALSKLWWAYKVSKWTKAAAEWTKLATEWTELAVKWEETLANPKTMKESKNIWQKIVDWFNKPLPKAWLEWWRAWLEFQLIWDVKDWKLSDAQAYWISAWLGAILSSTLWLIWAGGKSIVQPQEQLRTSLWRMWVKDVDEILNWAEAWAKDWTLPSALQRTTDAAVKEAKQNVKKALDEAWASLRDFRKNLWQSDLRVADFNKTINKWLTEKWIWAKIVEKDGKYVVEWYPWEYGDILNKITDRMNSAVENVKNKYELYKAWENVDFWTSTSVFEDLLSDLKWYSFKEPNAEVRQKFIEIENSLMDDLKWSMSDAQWKEYKKYLDDYAKKKTKYKKVEELEWKMNSRNVIDQPKMEDWQYLSEFLDELMSDWSISQWTKDRRIAAIFADSFYGVPVKQSDKVMYPSKAWWIEEIMRAFTRFFRNPRSSITWWWKSYAKDYVPSTARKTTKNVLKKAKNAAVWKSVQQPKQD